MTHLGSLAYGDTMVCGNLLDTNYIIENCSGPSPKMEECGLAVTERVRFSPWFEVEFDDDSMMSEPVVTFQRGLASLFQFQSDQVEVVGVNRSRQRFTLDLLTFSNYHEKSVMISLDLFHSPHVSNDHPVYTGQVDLIFGSDEPESRRLNAIPIHSMDFLCTLIHGA
jgi:hypothetical protein